MQDIKTGPLEHNLSFLKGEEKNPKQMVDFLQTDAVFRSFAQILSQFCHGNLKEKLVDGFADQIGESREHAARKVRNWMNGKHMPQNRETIFQICFILSLKEQEASSVLGMLSDTGIHYRNPKELAYAYALRMGQPYAKARELGKKAMDIYTSAVSKPEGAGDFDLKARNGFTRQMQECFAEVASEDELFAFVKEHGRELGRLHDTAYLKFIELLDLLQHPKGRGGEEEKAFTLDQVMEQYLRMNVPVQARNHKNDAIGQTEGKKLTAVQKLIKKCWPNEGTLVRMRRRQEDVSRKTLILLYLATEEFDFEPEEEDAYYNMEEIEEDADLMLEIRRKRMDLFLDTYGMNLLDPGNPFDFLVFYAMRAQEDDCMQERMEKMLNVLFPV